MGFRGRKILLTGSMALVAALVLLPFYIMVMMGTYYSNDLFKGLALVPGGYLRNNLATIFNANFGLFYFNSFYVALLASAGALLVSAMAGYAFSKFEFRGKQALFRYCLGTMMVPAQLGLIAFAWQMNKMGMANSHLPIIIPPMASMYGVFWMTQYMKTSVPNEILESARIDGCGELAMFWWMVLPLIRPAITSLGLLFFLWSWNNYLVPLVLISKPELYTVPLGIQSLRQLYRIDYGAQIIGLTIGTLPIILLFIVFSKNFVSGFTSAAIKG